MQLRAEIPSRRPGILGPLFTECLIWVGWRLDCLEPCCLKPSDSHLVRTITTLGYCWPRTYRILTAVLGVDKKVCVASTVAHQVFSFHYHYCAWKNDFQSIIPVQFTRSVVSDSLRPHESQHARPPCPSPTPGVHSNSRPSSQWCHPTISSSVVPFSSCLSSFNTVYTSKSTVFFEADFDETDFHYLLSLSSKTHFALSKKEAMIIYMNGCCNLAYIYNWHDSSWSSRRD